LQLPHSVEHQLWHQMCRLVLHCSLVHRINCWPHRWRFRSQRDQIPDFVTIQTRCWRSLRWRRRWRRCCCCRFRRDCSLDFADRRWRSQMRFQRSRSSVLMQMKCWSLMCCQKDWLQPYQRSQKDCLTGSVDFQQFRRGCSLDSAVLRRPRTGCFLETASPRRLFRKDRFRQMLEVHLLPPSWVFLSAALMLGTALFQCPCLLTATLKNWFALT